MKLLATLLLAASLSACGAGTARGDVAAEVGRRTITVDELRTLVDKGLADEQFAAQTGDGKADYQRQVLAQMVTSLLSEEAAKRLGVTVTPAQVAARRKQFEDQFAAQGTTLVQRAKAGGLPEDRIDAFVRDTVLGETIADNLVAGQQPTAAQLRTLDMATAQHILVADQKTADGVLAQLRAGGGFEALAKRFSTDAGTKENGGKLPPARRGEYVPEFDAAIFNGPLNVVQGPVKTQFGFHLIRVLSRKVATAANLSAEDRRTVLGQVRDTRFKEYMTELAEELGVEVNPRFGAWDAEGATIVESPDDLSSPSSTVAPVAPPGPGGASPTPTG